MLIKNSLKLLLNNLSIVFKTMLYSLVVVLLSYILVSVFFSDIVNRISQSTEFQVFLNDLHSLWNAFISGNLNSEIDLVSSFENLMDAIRFSLADYTWSFIGFTVGIYLITVLNNLCSYTLTYVMDARMSTYEKKGFFAAFVAVLKKSLPFEAWYSLLYILGFVVSLSASVIFIVYTFTSIYLFALVIGVWLFVVLFSFFLAMVALFRPLTVKGTPFKQLFKNRYTGSAFMRVTATFVFTLITVMCLNVTVFLTTLGAGTVISLSVSQFFIVLIQLVLLYSIEGKKYYIDYETIETPNKIKEDSKNAGFLEDVEV